MTVSETQSMHKSEAIADLVRRLFGAMAAGDVNTLPNLISRDPGVVVIGSDPREWWAGHDEFIRAARAQTDEMGGSFPIVMRDLVAYERGDMGWAAGEATLQTPDGEVPFRASVVAQREDGKWKLVHAHLSFGVSNEESLGKELTV